MMVKVIKQLIAMAIVFSMVVCALAMQAQAGAKTSTGWRAYQGQQAAI